MIAGENSISAGSLRVSQHQFIPLSSDTDSALEHQSLQSVLPDPPKGWTRRAITNVDYEVLSINRVESNAKAMTLQDYLEFRIHGWVYERRTSIVVLRAYLLGETQSVPRFRRDSDDVSDGNVEELRATTGWGVIKGFSYNRFDAENIYGATLHVVAGQSTGPHRVHIEARGLGSSVGVQTLLRAIDYDTVFSISGTKRGSIKRAASSLWHLPEEENGTPGGVNDPSISNANQENTARGRFKSNNATEQGRKLPGHNCNRENSPTRCIVTR
ncbi:MAG: hypothetical protein ABJM90_13845 [Paracoccaceae bacterium]